MLPTVRSLMPDPAAAARTTGQRAAMSQFGFDALTKVALQIEETQGFRRSLADTVGTLSTLPTAVLLDPFHLRRVLTTPSVSDVDTRTRLLQEQHPDELKDVHVQVGGQRPLQELKRIWQNKRTGLLMKSLGTLGLPYETLTGLVSREDSYSPASNTVNIYSSSPGILEHELGHAVDFNRQPTSIRRDLYSMAPTLFDYAGIPLAESALTLWQEREATRHALNAAPSAEAKADMWRTVAPAYGTYSATAIHGLLNHMASKNLIKYPLKELGDTITAALPTFLPGVVRNTLGPVTAAFVVPATGALVGHGVAALRNHLAARKDEGQS